MEFFVLKSCRDATGRSEEHAAGAAARPTVRNSGIFTSFVLSAGVLSGLRGADFHIRKA
jgi:hypothetical protein